MSSCKPLARPSSKLDIEDPSLAISLVALKAIYRALDFGQFMVE